MLKSLIISFFLVLCYSGKAQENNIEKVSLQFRYFKYPNAVYNMDYQKNELSCLIYRNYREINDTLFYKTYAFTDKESEKIKAELNQDIPRSVLVKSESSTDGGGFDIYYFKKKGHTSRLTVRNPTRRKPEYIKEFKKIDAFFDFAYSIVKDSVGIDALDNTYRPYFSGLPIRKVSDNPLEYRIWGSISGDASTNASFIAFLDNLPKDKCVIMDCNDELSYALQQDILRLYIIKNSPLHFLNNSNLKNTRNHLLDIRNEIGKAKNNPEQLKEFDHNSTYKLYLSDVKAMDKWLELPEKLQFPTAIEIRKNCR